MWFGHFIVRFDLVLVSGFLILILVVRQNYCHVHAGETHRQAICSKKRRKNHGKKVKPMCKLFILKYHGFAWICDWHILKQDSVQFQAVDSVLCRHL